MSDEKITGTIADGSTGAVSAVVVTNTRKTGDLIISKVLVTDVAADSEAEYTFTIQLSEKVNGTYKLIRKAAAAETEAPAEEEAEPRTEKRRAKPNRPKPRRVKRSPSRMAKPP